MAETEPAVQEPQEIPYNITVEDAGPATKKVTIEIPEELIASKLAEQFQDLRREAAVPGFRPGHAPAKLIERRFQGDVKQQVCRTLISQAYEQASKKIPCKSSANPNSTSPKNSNSPNPKAHLLLPGRGSTRNHPAAPPGPEDQKSEGRSPRKAY
jgi:FKBP-type peptidyl-prolyl cis-trans isomerase (trigger factor)